MKIADAITEKYFGDYLMRDAVFDGIRALIEEVETMAYTDSGATSTGGLTMSDRESELREAVSEELNALEDRACEEGWIAKFLPHRSAVVEYIQFLKDEREAFARKAFFAAADLFVDLDVVRNEIEDNYQAWAKEQRGKDEK